MAKTRIVERITPAGRKFFDTVKQLKGRKPHVKVGYPAEDSKTNEKHEDADGMTVLQLAVIHEFGVPNAGPGGNTVIPERSWIRASYDESKRKLLVFSRKVAQRVIKGEISVKAGLSQIGLFMLNRQKKKMRSNIPPELAPSTKAGRSKKGDANPKALIDTAQLLNSASTKVIMNQ